MPRFSRIGLVPCSFAVSVTRQQAKEAREWVDFTAVIRVENAVVGTAESWHNVVELVVRVENVHGWRPVHGFVGDNVTRCLVHFSGIVFPVVVSNISGENTLAEGCIPKH